MDNSNKKLTNEKLIEQLIKNKLFKEAKELEQSLGLSLHTTVGTEEWLAKFITQDEEMLRLKDKVRKLVSVQDPVLIQGETGTGKELIARALHGKRLGQFIAINCAGMPENLIESELFGHVAGAFTGATKDKKGLMEAAVDGTIFFDEIGELLPALQSKLLRAIQEMSVRRVGSNEEIPINCRIVSATHHDLNIANESFYLPFRSDLYHRISTFTLYTTPLAMRSLDVPLIIDSLDPNGDCPRNVSPTTGNVRGLQQIVRRYQVLNELPN